MKNGKYIGVWRRKAVETHGFPKLMVHDNCVTGSINVRNTRLPLWAIIHTTINEGWDAVEKGWSPEKDYGFTLQDLSCFLYYLLEQRGEFGRLLLLLANVERLEGEEGAWWENNTQRQKVIKQLQNCMDTLRGID